jgi:hypothetical protein
MAAKRPRFSITVSEELNSVLLELSELTGGARASLAAEFLEECLPAISQILEAVRVAKTDSLAALEIVNDALLNAQSEAVNISKDISETRRKIRGSTGNYKHNAK